MEIIKADETHIPAINLLLKQVLSVHHKIRPDIFKLNSKKYADSELKSILLSEDKPIFVYIDKGQVLGYCFCIINNVTSNNVLKDNKTLYIDDLCVDENYRGKGIGKSLYNYVLEYAKSIKCFNVTLNVWAGNESAMGFYQSLGFKPQKTYMEVIIKE